MKKRKGKNTKLSKTELIDWEMPHQVLTMVIRHRKHRDVSMLEFFLTDIICAYYQRASTGELEEDGSFHYATQNYLRGKSPSTVRRYRKRAEQMNFGGHRLLKIKNPGSLFDNYYHINPKAVVSLIEKDIVKREQWKKLYCYGKEELWYLDHELSVLKALSELWGSLMP